MTTRASIPPDWTAWDAEEPPPDFAERVLHAVRTRPERTAAKSVPRGRPRRHVTVLAAAAALVVSLGLLAAVGPRLGVRLTGGPGEPASIPRLDATHGAAEHALVSPPAKRTPSALPAASPFGAGTVLDRALRERLRPKLRPALAAEGSEKDPHTGLTVPAGAAGSALLSREYISERIRSDFLPLARSCYEAALTEAPKLKGKIVIDFMLVGDPGVGGIVDQAKLNEATNIKEPELLDCMLGSMLSMVFAPPQNNGWVSITYPFEFSPDDDEPESAPPRR